MILFKPIKANSGGVPRAIAQNDSFGRTIMNKYGLIGSFNLGVLNLLFPELGDNEEQLAAEREHIYRYMVQLRTQLARRDDDGHRLLVMRSFLLKQMEKVWLKQFEYTHNKEKARLARAADRPAAITIRVVTDRTAGDASSARQLGRRSGSVGLAGRRDGEATGPAERGFGEGRLDRDGGGLRLNRSSGEGRLVGRGVQMHRLLAALPRGLAFAAGRPGHGREADARLARMAGRSALYRSAAARLDQDGGIDSAPVRAGLRFVYAPEGADAPEGEAARVRMGGAQPELQDGRGTAQAALSTAYVRGMNQRRLHAALVERELYREPIAASVWRGMELWSTALYGLRELAARRGRERRDANRVHGRGGAALPPEAAGLVDRVVPPHAGGGVGGVGGAAATIAEARLFRALMPVMLSLQGADRYADSAASFFPWNETRMRGAQQYSLLLNEVSPGATQLHVMQWGGRQSALPLTYRQLTDSSGMQWAVMQSAFMDRQRLHSVWPGLPGRNRTSAALLHTVAGHDAEHALASPGVRAHDVPVTGSDAGKARVQLRFTPSVAAQLTASSAAWPTSAPTPSSPAGLRDISSGEGAAAQLQLAYADAAYSTRLSYHAPLSESVSERLGERVVLLQQLLRRDSERAARVRPALGGNVRSAASEGTVKAHVLAGQTLFADDLRRTARRDALVAGRDHPVAAGDAAFTRRLYYTPLHDHIRARQLERRNFEYTRIFYDDNSNISATGRAASGQMSKGELSIQYTRPGQTQQLQPVHGQSPDRQGGLRAGDGTARPEDSLALPQRADDRDIARLLLLYHMPLMDSVSWRTSPLAAGYAPPRGRMAAAQRAVAAEEARSDAYMSRSSARLRTAAAGSSVRLEHGGQSSQGAVAGRDAGLRRTGLLLRIRYAEQPAADHAAARAARTEHIEQIGRTAEDSTSLAHRTANRRGAADTVSPQAAIVHQYAIDEAKTSDQQLYRAPLAQQVWRERLQWLTTAEPSLSRMLEHAEYGDGLSADGGDEAVWRRGRRRSSVHERAAQAARPGNVRVRFFAPEEDAALHPGQRQAPPLADRMQAVHLSAPQAERMYRAPLADTVWTGQLSWLAAPLGQMLAADDGRGSMPAVWRRRAAQRMAAAGSTAAVADGHDGIAERLGVPGRMPDGIGLPVDLRHSGDAHSLADAGAARATVQAQFASSAERVRRLAEQPDAAGAGQARQSRRETDEMLQLLRVSLARNVWTHRLRMLADRRLAALDNVLSESEDAGRIQPQVMFRPRLNRAASWLSRAARPDAEAAMYLTNYYMRHMATASRLARIAVAGDDFVDVFGGSLQADGLSRRASAGYSDSLSLERAYRERQNPLLTYALQMTQAVSGNVPAAGGAGMAEQRTARPSVGGGGARASLSETVWTERLRMLSPTAARERGAAIPVAASDAARASRGRQQAGEQPVAQLAAWPQTPLADGPALTLPFADNTPERVNAQSLAAYSSSTAPGNDSRTGQREGLAALTQSFLEMWPYHKSRRPYRRAARYVRSFLQRHLLSDHPVAQRWLSVYDSGLHESALSVHSAADSDAANVGERRESHPAATVKAPVQFVLPLPQTGERPDEPQRASRSAFAGETRARAGGSGRRESAMYKRLLGALVDYAVDAAWPGEAAHRAARQQRAERAAVSARAAESGAAAAALPEQPKARGAAQRKMPLPPMLTANAGQLAGRQPERRIGRQLEQQMERQLERSQQQQFTLPLSSMLSATANRAIAAADGYAEGWPGAATAFAASEELEWLIPSAGEQHDAVRRAGGSETTEGRGEGLQPLVNALRRASRSVDGPAVAALRQLAGGLLSGTQLKLLRSEVETNRWFGQQSALLSAKLPAQLSGVSKRPTTPGEARQVAAKLLTLYQTARAFAAAASAGAVSSEASGGSGAAAPAGGLIVMPPTAADIGQAATASMLAAAPARDRAASAAMRDAAQAQPAAQARAAQARSPLSGGVLALALAAPAASLLTQHNALAAAISSPLAPHNALAATPLTPPQRQSQQLGALPPPARAADWRPYAPAAPEAAEPPPDWPRLDYGAAPPDSTGTGYEAEAEQQRHPELSYSAPAHTQAQTQAQSDTGSSTTITPVQFNFEQPAQESKPEPTSLDIEEIADRVYRELERKMRFEQQRRGF